MIEVRSRSVDDLTIVELRGEVCLVTVPVIRSCVERLLQAGGGAVVIDLRDVSLFGAAGATLLIGLAEELGARGRTLSIRGAYGLTARVIELSGLAPLVDVDDEVGAR